MTVFNHYTCSHFADEWTILTNGNHSSKKLTQSIWLTLTQWYGGYPCYWASFVHTKARSHSTTVKYLIWIYEVTSMKIPITSTQTTMIFEAEQIVDWGWIKCEAYEKQWTVPKALTVQSSPHLYTPSIEVCWTERNW